MYTRKYSVSASLPIPAFKLPLNTHHHMPTSYVLIYSKKYHAISPQTGCRFRLKTLARAPAQGIHPSLPERPPATHVTARSTVERGPHSNLSTLITQLLTVQMTSKCSEIHKSGAIDRLSSNFLHITYIDKSSTFAREPPLQTSFTPYLSCYPPDRLQNAQICLKVGQFAES